MSIGRLLVKKHLLQLGSVVFFSAVLLGVAVPRCDDPVFLCESAAQIVAKTEKRCGSNRGLEEAEQSFKDKVAYGDCNTIKKIRDSKMLEKECLPWLERAPCELILQGKILPACINQFSTSKN